MSWDFKNRVCNKCGVEYYGDGSVCIDCRSNYHSPKYGEVLTKRQLEVAALIAEAKHKKLVHIINGREESKNGKT